MHVFEFELSGDCRKDFDTEIRFNIATANYDNVDLVKIKLPKREEQRECDRLISCVSRVLGALRKAGTIQFYLTPSMMQKMTTEAQYVHNKFSDHLTQSDEFIYIYVKC